MMELFEKLLSLHLEYLEQREVFKSHEKTLDSLYHKIKERIEEDTEKTNEKIEQYKKTAADESRPATVRRLAEKELETLQGISFPASEEEKEAFANELDELKSSYRELCKIDNELGKTFESMFRKLEELRKQSHWDNQRSSFPYYIQGREEEYRRICKWGDEE